MVSLQAGVPRALPRLLHAPQRPTEGYGYSHDCRFRNGVCASSTPRKFDLYLTFSIFQNVRYKSVLKFIVTEHFRTHSYYFSTTGCTTLRVSPEDLTSWVKQMTSGCVPMSCEVYVSVFLLEVNGVTARLVRDVFVVVVLDPVTL